MRRRGVVWIEAAEDAKAAPAWPEGARVGVRRLPRLYVAGEEEHAPRRLLDWLKRQAHLDLKMRVDLHARRLNLAPKRLFVRDQTTRWGSCSTSGALSFSWRLVLAPPFVLDYLAAHEVAHLAHMNHGPRFWALVERTMPRHEEAPDLAQEAWREPASLWRRGHGAVLAHLAEAQHRITLSALLTAGEDTEHAAEERLSPHFAGARSTAAARSVRGSGARVPGSGSGALS